MADADADEMNDSVDVRFPTMLRVLLVEPDDSTRYIISALLRKCGYKVTALRDGLKAWETLKNKSLHIDLLLTEVDLPNSLVSGFSLLASIMEHPNCKNIPVIMMSSHDSVSTVFKCMLNGAVDFLIKPVRRNELRNLWQHVWRRHTISKPPQNKTTFPHNNKLDVAVENNDATNNFSGSVASMQSEKTSEAQDMSLLKSSSSLSCTDKVKLENCTKFETEFAECNDETGGLRLGQSCDHSETENQDEVLRTELSKANPHINTNIHRFNDELEEGSAGAIDLIATFENLPKSSYANCSFNGGNMEKFDFDTQLELSLQRDLPGSSPKPSAEERQILNRSYASAFSWYGSSNLLEQPLFPTQNSHESHILSENTITSHQYEEKNQKQESITYLMIGPSGQVDARFPNSQLGVFPATGANSDHKSMGHRSAFDSMFYAQSGMHPSCTPKSVCQKESSPFPMIISSQSNPKSQNSDDATYTNDQNVNDQRNIDCAIHDSPSNGQSCGTSFYHDGENHNTSGVCEGIGSGSDGNASSAVVDKNNLESSSSNDHYDGLRSTNSHRTSEREAALTKFRLKRKDRCFEKKVRYESRKRQADKRPRVKGQFVRHVHSELPVADTGGY